MQEPPCRGKEHRKIVFVVGPLTLQNDLMAFAIQELTGARCIPLNDRHDLSPLDNEGEPNALVLWDCHGKDVADCLIGLESQRAMVSW